MMARVLLCALLVATLYCALASDDVLSDESETMVVSKDNPHCDYTRRDGPLCDMAGVAAVSV